MYVYKNVLVNCQGQHPFHRLQHVLRHKCTAHTAHTAGCSGLCQQHRAAKGVAQHNRRKISLFVCAAQQLEEDNGLPLRRLQVQRRGKKKTCVIAGRNNVAP